MPRESQIIVGLDIGTTKVCVIVGEMRADGQTDIIGIGTHPSRGLKKGTVINIESTVDAIVKAVEEAKRMAGVEIDLVYTGISGGHIKGLNSRGVIAVKRTEVSQADVDRAIETATAVAIPSDQKIFHVIPQEFVVDSHDGIKEPLGMSGVRLEAEVHIITGAVSAMENIEKSIRRAGLTTARMILQPLASSEAVLTQDEKELGVAMIDIGGGTTDLALFTEGSIRHTAVIPVGGGNFTNDIAIGLRTPPAEAEKIKIKYGSAQADRVRDGETVEVPSVGGRSPRLISRQMLAEIIQPRAEEIFMLVGQEIERVGFDSRITSGAVITGGTSVLPGMEDAAERILGCPVRLGIPSGLGGLMDVVGSPIYATGVGLVLYAARHHAAQTGQSGSILHRTKNRLLGWTKEFF
jgi:cell division protein FtsA